MASKAGGGIKSRQVVRPGVRVGQAAQGKRHQAVSQIGQNLGNHATGDGKIHRSAVERVEGAPRPISVQLGNENARELSGANCGVGKGRTIYRSGTQSAPTTRAMPQGRDTLSEFGRESPIVRDRK
jgi:hypothetical protein